MFGIGPMELIVVAVVAMVFIGPEKLPEMMRKFGKIFVQVRRQANDVRNSFSEVIHEAERDLELERIREMQSKLQNTTPAALLESALLDSNGKPLIGPGLDADGHPMAGYDHNGFPLPGLEPYTKAEDHSRDYHEGHYVDGKFEHVEDGFQRWDPAKDRSIAEMYPLHPTNEQQAGSAEPAEPAQETKKEDIKSESLATNNDLPPTSNKT